MSISIPVHVATTALSLIFAGVAAAQQSNPVAPLPLDPRSTSANWWPWVAVGALVMVLGAIAIGARRQSPFGKRTG